LKGAFFYLCQAVSGIDFISISQPSANKAECLMNSRDQKARYRQSSPAPEANENLAKAKFYTENGKSKKRPGFWLLFFIFFK
jgi:DNA modification methylase